MHRVVQRHLGERHIADHKIDVIWESGRLEALVADLGVRVEQRGDAGGDRFQLNANRVNVEVVRAGGEEDAGAAPRFQDAAPVEAEIDDQLPHGSRDGGVGVVRVEGRAPSGGELLDAK